MAPEDLRLADYTIPDADLDEIQSPALLVFLDKVRHDVSVVVEALGGDVGRWRPHVKTAKIPRVLQELIAAGVRHFKCATTRELDGLLRTLDESGVRDADVLLAYPLAGPAIRRVERLAVAHPGARISILCDDPAAAGEIGPGVGLFVDIDPGMNRTGLPMADAGAILAAAVSLGDRFRGLHFYEGHVRETDGARRRAVCFPLFDELIRISERLGGEGIPVREIVTSGTPTFLEALAHPGLASGAPFRHRVSPGTVVYADARSLLELPHLALRPAAVVLSRVVSRPCAGVITCDAGSKAIPPEGRSPCAYVIGRDGLLPGTSSEEHLTVSVLRGEPPRRGDVLLLLPFHVCTTVNVADEAVLLDGGSVVDVVPVGARGHEVRARGAPL
jgi:D-serine deaminase-like pyridoxal phosphate-dependent protein